MGWFGSLVLAVALAMDAFTVAAVTALALDIITRRHVFRLSFHFGLFQSLMLVIGALFGSAASTLLSSCDHWIALALLAFVGGRMIWGGLMEATPVAPDRTRGWDLVLLSIATSVDALAVGISLALIHAAIVGPAILIGVVAAALTALGMVIGRRIGAFWGKRVEILGGSVLIAIGLRILWQHLST